MGEIHKPSIFDDKFLFQKAYKKLKSNAYYDKTKAMLKKEIVEFENGKNGDEKLDEFLIDIWKKFIFLKDEEWQNYIKNEALNGINCVFFPKKLKEDKTINSCIISNVEDDLQQIEVDEVQAFIELPVIGHILSIAWVMTIGAVIDRQMTNCYGNRLRDDLHNVGDCCSQKNKITFSPYLFKPYYLQYEKWQDNALKVAEQHLKNDDDILIFTLDFERFYYSLDITNELMQDIFKKVCPSDANTKIKKCLGRLNDFVNNVIECYATKYEKYFPNANKRILPIGFLPSNILANYALKKFDECILNSQNTLYFGRYVDDVIIVDKISHSHPLYERIRAGKITMTEFIAEYLWSCCKSGILQVSIENQSCQLGPCVLPSLGKNTKLSFNIEKCKIFYFSHKNSSELLTKFRNYLGENKSEFRFLPEDKVPFQEDSYTQIFDVKQHELNKFRDISEIKLNKYNLSKFLAKYQQMISNHLCDDVKFINKVINSLTDTQLIENYTMWERIITIFSLQKEKRLLIKMVVKIERAIDKISYSATSDTKKKSHNYLIECNVRGVLRRVLFFDLCRVQSVLRLFSSHNEDCLRKYEDCLWLRKKFLTFFDLSVKYEKARMGDKYLYVIWPEVFLICQDIICQNKQDHYKKYSRNDLQSVLVLLTDTGKNWNFIRDRLRGYRYYPYLVQNYDILLAYQCISLVSNSEHNNNHQNSISPFLYEEAFDLFLEVNFQLQLNSSSDLEKRSGCNHGFFVKDISKKIPGHIFEVVISNKPKNEFKVAVSNIKIELQNTEKNLVCLPTTTQERWKDISRIVNTALYNHADILVMPECCLPFTWLSILAHICKKNDLAVITGLEHLIVGKRIYNLVAVILPFAENKVPCALVVLHPKNHFSPKEFQSLFERGFIPMDAGHLLGTGQNQYQYELYQWHDFYFSVYCCFELSAITERSLFQSYADAIFAVEWNQDINYYQNILEALARDLHCYCIQANSSDYGDSRITQPSKHDNQDILRVKGGESPTVLIGIIDVEKLRLFQCKSYGEQKEDRCFKPTPPLFDREIVEKKIRKERLF